MKTTHITLLTILIAITAACGYSSANMPGAKPAIAMLSPDSVSAGGPAFTLTVNGSNFAANAVVNWNGVARPTKYVSVSQLKVAIPASMIVTSGSAQITVTNPATAGNGMYGGGTLAVTSSPMDFVIN
jgi:hypothetical protein